MINVGVSCRSVVQSRFITMIIGITPEVRDARQSNAIMLIRDEQRRRRRLKKKLKRDMINNVRFGLSPILPEVVGAHISKFLPVNMDVALSTDIQEKMHYEQVLAKYMWDGERVVRI